MKQDKQGERYVGEVATDAACSRGIINLNLNFRLRRPQAMPACPSGKVRLSEDKKFGTGEGNSKGEFELGFTAFVQNLEFCY
jgi:hypothetical protein